MSFLAKALLLGTAIVVSGFASGVDAVTPKWPSVFSTTYESYWLNTTGKYLYLEHGSKGPAERIDFDDGSRDHLCSTFHKNTPCSQLTTQGFRYLHFPEIDDCCKCCTYVEGTYECGGVLSPKWLSNATGNVAYHGIETVRGHACHKWTIVGLMPEHPNFYWQSVETGLPCGLQGYNYLKTPAERADDQYLFDVDTMRLEASESLFQVPELCKGSRYCGDPVCATGPELDTLALA
ncbi:Hypothetical Protein FCC1311_044262 [Hondaea fermentalgiana]|uniref:Uncharacterized protein n=1 Tax=Hondaea fermentalgiana TaxID=2315210 RepID=A0A2R5GHS8_9STRA|nr:Hypothetical Protein FCC1311_044262 [Hondaea fermentalgiana]|eukprot:GBG28203.1 Hypothetical Protein FCC1311_044262 [Hondaea fermentalgiana]